MAVALACWPLQEADESHARFYRRPDRISEWHHHSVRKPSFHSENIFKAAFQSALSFLLSAFCSFLFHDVCCSVNFITAFAPAMHQQPYRRSCFLYFYTLLIDGAWIVLELPSQDWLHGSTEPPADRVRRIWRPLCLPTWFLILCHTLLCLIQLVWIYSRKLPSICSILSITQPGALHNHYSTASERSLKIISDWTNIHSAEIDF